MAKPYILCVDDERTVLDALMTQLKAHLGNNFMYESAESAEEALELLDEIAELRREVALVISDQMMPNMKGDELLAEVHRRSPSTMKVLLTGVTTTEELGRAINDGKLYRYITKPWEKYDLQMTAEEATKTYLQRAEIEQYTKQLEQLVTGGQSLSKANSIDELSQEALQYLIDGTGADRGGILTMGLDNQVIASHYFEREEGWEYTFHQDDERFPKHLVEAVLKCDEALLISSPEDSTLFTPTYLQQYKPRSIYCKPLWYDNELAGLLYLESTIRRSNFTATKLRYIELLAQQAALAIGRLKTIMGLEQTVEDRTAEIRKQALVIENKNRDLLDSIQYARRLQTNFMPSAEYMGEVFSESFLYYKPKSIVSGDFYWVRETKRYVHFAVVDCTGHGVPGGMLSILGLNLLNQLISEEEILHPDEVLFRMNRFFHKRLVEKSSGLANNASYDSMDIALCTLDKERMRLEFAGAKRPLYLLRNGKIEEYKGDSFSLGGSPISRNAEHTFKRHFINLNEGDRAFLFSDGIVDQFGGKRSKKFTPKRLRQLIMSHAKDNMAQLELSLQKQMENWQGELDQTDDILLMGIDFSPLFGDNTRFQAVQELERSLEYPMALSA